MIKRQKTKTIKLPGKRLLKHIKYGIPTDSDTGIYLVYYKLKYPRAMSSSFPIADYEVIKLQNGKTPKNLNILAYIGPFPALTLDELADNYKEEDLSLHVYCIGTLKGAAELSWKQGPFQESLDAVLQKGKKGDFIFEVNQRTTVPKPLYIYKNNRFIKLKNPKKAIEKIKLYQNEIKGKKTAKKQSKKSIKQKNDTYGIGTIKQAKNGKFERKYPSIIKAFGFVPDDLKAKVYIFEFTKLEIVPVWAWKMGWDKLSDKKVRKIKKVVNSTI